MKIVFLYSELMPNLLIVIRALVENHSAQVHIVYWDHRRRTPYEPEPMKGVTYHRRSQHGVRDLRRLLGSIGPDAIYIVGWMDRAYLAAVVSYRRKRVPVVVGFDDWWRGTARQRAGRAFSPLLTKVFFSHAWVAGPRQYEYAKRLGFADRCIVPNLLSCDTALFEGAYSSLGDKRAAYPRVFLYVGRFSPEKGIDLLAEAFEKYRTTFHGTWKLVCVGNGPLSNVLAGKPNIDVRPFGSQADVVKAMQEAGVFVAASLRDFSPLVVHEAACAGLPMILSSNVGNIPLFMIHRHNGVVFESGSVDGLAAAMHELSNTPVERLVAMGRRSHRLSRRIDPEACAASLVSCMG
jgi:glycosyltransferase involved in cell wall biosynthesis